MVFFSGGGSGVGWIIVLRCVGLRWEWVNGNVECWRSKCDAKGPTQKWNGDQESSAEEILTSVV